MAFNTTRAAALAGLAAAAIAGVAAPAQPAQTNAIEPEAANPEPESRQVRRARRRALLKHSPPSLYIGAPVGRSKYLPHESVKRGGTGPKFAA